MLNRLIQWWHRRDQPFDQGDDLPYGAGANARLDTDLWEYGKKSGWW